MTFVPLLVFLAPLLICSNAQAKPKDCTDILKTYRYSRSGVFGIYPFDDRFRVLVYCDMETDRGAWTMIQRRMDGTVNFCRPWDQYVSGFGKAYGEYWLGLEFIHKITNRSKQELLVEMEDFDGNKAFAKYSSFSVGPECQGYKMNVSGFINGGAGNSLTVHNGMKFTTLDKDQDIYKYGNCAKRGYGGWWYASCHHANPNGIYLWGSAAPYYAGINWSTWKGLSYSLKSISFKIRPAK
ncbi:microfibril-associated glycoprotein 4-like [Boleophthalmus pectinirostris]|uniref:microfibril-associated glycoprotein 4-like n=1 Tax=Boleophthalmus pectinirostris TaxID=150288 RepID=UPI00242FD207|nr:microfibril-associated glycoprotein 4-like [Boleophthalmus pectinirostris]